MSRRPLTERDRASDTLATLASQADALRAELSRLRLDLATLHEEEHRCHAQELRAANEKLLIASLAAGAVAENAEESMAGLILSSQRDVLTNTPNRALTFERLEHAIGMAKHHDVLMAVLFVDLDHLKSINDSLGHAAGDAALQLTARRLESIVRSTDTVSRHGGDEFLVLLSELSRPSDAADIAAKMLDALSDPAQIAGHALCLTASIGISIFPTDASTAPQLIEVADSAMYAAKRLGGGRFGFNEPAQMVDKPPCFDSRGKGSTRPELPAMALLRQVSEQLVIRAIADQELRDFANAHR